MCSKEVLGYFATPGPLTDLERHSEAMTSMSSDPEALAKIVRGLLIHNFMATIRGLDLPSERLGDMQIPGAAATLDRVLELDASPIDSKRPAERRMVGFCYHFALLHTAFLRAKGVPARTRCGFASYFDAGKWIDHWVTEYWDGETWRLNDPQIGRNDLTADDFQDGIRAWQDVRSGTVDAASYGNGELWGWDELRGSLVNDIGALNKLEIPGWYWCDRIKIEPIDQPHEDLDAALDELAEEVRGADSVAGLTAALERDSGLKPPADAIAR
jgi:hypothetical protein